MTNFLMEHIDFHLLKRQTKSGKSVYYAGFLADTRGANKKHRYKSIRSTKTGNRALAEKRARAMLADGQVLADKDDLRTFLIDFWTPGKSQYLMSSQAEKGRKLNSVYLQNNRQRIKEYVLPYFETRGISNIAELTRENITEWRNYLFTHGHLPEYTPPKPEPDESKRGQFKRKSKIGTATQNKVRQAFFVPLQWAVEMGKLPYHPGANVKRLKTERTEASIFEVAELALLFADSTKWDDYRAFAACLLAANTGMRLGEIRGLQVRNVFFADQEVNVVTNYVDGDGLKIPKWESKRTGVRFGVVTARALSNVIQLSPFGADPNSFVFFAPRSRKKPVESKLITKALKRRIEAVKIPAGRSFKSFRDTFISHQRAVLGDSKTMRVVGHVNVTTTDGYTHLTAEDKRMIDSYSDSFLKTGDAG